MKFAGKSKDPMTYTRESVFLKSGACCEFVGGLFETWDEVVIEELKGLGYEQIEEVVTPPLKKAEKKK